MRRKSVFITNIGNIFFIILICLTAGSDHGCNTERNAQSVYFIFDKSLPQASYALARIKEAMSGDEYSIQEGQTD